jgi:hypothetical protein
MQKIVRGEFLISGARMVRRGHQREKHHGAGLIQLGEWAATQYPSTFTGDAP